MLARLHVRLETISAHNLMRVRTTNQPRIYERVQALDCELRACKAHHSRAVSSVWDLHLRVRDARKREREKRRDLHDTNDCFRAQL
jgi:hypothetical protein